MVVHCRNTRRHKIRETNKQKSKSLFRLVHSSSTLKTLPSERNGVQPHRKSSYQPEEWGLKGFRGDGSKPGEVEPHGDYQL